MPKVMSLLPEEVSRDDTEKMSFSPLLVKTKNIGTLEGAKPTSTTPKISAVLLQTFSFRLIIISRFIWYGGGHF